DHAIMLDHGELIVVRKFKELLKLDRDSNLIWRRNGPVHHDVALAEDGTLYVVGKLRREYRGLRVRFSTIMHLTNQGTLIDMFSTYDRLDDIKRAFDQKSFLDTQLDRPAVSKLLDDLSDALRSLMGKKKREEKKREIFAYFHANTVTPIQDTELGRRDGRFARRNLLTCFRNINQIAVLDKDNWEILWVWGENVLEEPHHPTMTDDGTILVFDNGVRREYSTVIELDPVTKEIVWEYSSDPREDFFSPTKGSAQRLPNGNTLICDGDSGRTFEVTRDGEIVWEWFNPRMKDGRRERVYRMMRLSPQRVAEALARPELSSPQ
ncbi:MAG: hypothetical protein JSW58_09955, partial [Candidatus Latescibacterota bacterium]